MKKISLALLTLLVALTACKKVPEVNLKYVDVERDLITVGTSTATVQCDYQYIATLKNADLYYGEGVNETDMNTAEMRVVQNTLYVDLEGLTENTTYSYYYEFHNGFNSMRTVTKTFKTETTPVVMILPTVITAEVTEITDYSAQCGGEVINDGGAEVTERGICWNTDENPTLNDNHIAAGLGLGIFTALMDSLQDNTTYHIRAYATNEVGTAYGLDREFTTLRDVPEGAINGLFSVSPIQKVYFSQGNLQYQASTNIWRFAENQWDFVGSQSPYSGNAGGTVSGSDNSSISPTYFGWIDLFSWGTSGYHDADDPNNVNYQPWSISTSTINSDYNYYGYGPSTNMTDPNLTCTSANYDWGVYNPISNGGNQANLWRTLTIEEWVYVFNTRITTSGIRYAKANVNNVNGVILLPDDWNSSTYNLNNTNSSGDSFSSNTITAVQWTTLEDAGAVFLPAAGYRHDTSVKYAGDHGDYWSTSYSSSEKACHLCFDNSNLGSNISWRPDAQGVRLVQDANP